MRRFLVLIALLGALTAHATPASQESVERLLDAARAESTVNALYAGMEQMMRQSMAQATQGKSLGAEQQRVLDAVPGKFVAVIRAEMSWQKLKPLYVQLYRDTFEQEEVDGLLAFYASPAGLALLDKTPLLVQKSMALSQSLLASVLPRMTAAMKEAMSEARIPGEK